jgi:hypothetical protein
MFTVDTQKKLDNAREAFALLCQGNGIPVGETQPLPRQAQEEALMNFIEMLLPPLTFYFYSADEQFRNKKDMCLIMQAILEEFDKIIASPRGERGRDEELAFENKRLQEIRRLEELQRDEKIRIQQTRTRQRTRLAPLPTPSISQVQNVPSSIVLPPHFENRSEAFKKAYLASLQNK